MVVDPVVARLRVGFLSEADELCQKATRLLLELERATAPGESTSADLDALLRILHTLKGSSATVELDDLAHLGHAMEDQVQRAQLSSQAVPRQLVDVLLGALDIWLSRLRAHVEGRSGELPSIDQVLAELEGAAPAVKAPAPSAPAPLSASTGEGEDGWRVEAHQVVTMMRDIERFRELRLRLDERGRVLERALRELEGLKLGLQGLDLRTTLQDTARALSLDADEAGVLGDSLEDGIRAISTQSLHSVLEPLHRLVRDVARACGKEVKLSLVGGELSLDRKLVAQLRGPLVHLVRNAVDHGIEAPEERRRLGKHEEGSLVIRAEQQGNIVFIELADDGAGLDLERIRAVARARGLPFEGLSEAETAGLVFSPGFSTRAQVTESSGRGVGLDVVRHELALLGGRAEVFSVPSRGTRFVLTVPTELGTSPILAVRCEDQLLGVPLLAIEAVVPARANTVRSSSAGMRLTYAERLLPLFDLNALLGISRPRLPEHGQPVLVLLSQGKRAAVTVDAVVGEHDLVIQPLPSQLRDIAAYQGASTLAGGELMLVLQPGWLTGAQHGAAVAAPVTRHALVVDDSLTARAMHRAILEAGGFTVYGAATAEVALRQLERHAYELIVCDLAMPVMDGLTFARRVRLQPGLERVPLIIVSGRNRPNDQAEALAAGADGYLTKHDCVSGRLMAEVNRALQRQRGAS